MNVVQKNLSACPECGTLHWSLGATRRRANPVCCHRRTKTIKPHMQPALWSAYRVGGLDAMYDVWTKMRGTPPLAPDLGAGHVRSDGRAEPPAHRRSSRARGPTGSSSTTRMSS